MSELNNSHLLRSITKLIEKPEITALEVSLTTTLRDLISAEKILFYQLRTLKNPDTEHLEAHLLPLGSESDGMDEIPYMRLADAPDFSECLDKMTMIVRKVDGPTSSYLRFIHPVVGVQGPNLSTKGVTGFLVVESTDQIDRDQELITILLGFYRNYVSLLNDNQRDHLTGLLNRKSFDDRIMKIILSLSEVNKRVADKVSYSLAVLDIDHFKNVNDTYGHLLGDEVLLHFAQCMNDTFREYDLLFRVGGEEFVVVLRNVDAMQSSIVFERFRKNIEDHYFPQVGKITASIGVAAILSTDLPVTIMDRADQALYYAKEHGRNQVCFYDMLVTENKLQVKVVADDVELF